MSDPIFEMEGKLTLDKSEYQKGLKESEQSTDDLAASSVAFGQLAAQAVEKVVSSLGNLVSSLVSVAAETETAYAQLETISGSENIDALSSALLELSSATGTASSDLAITAYNAISAGTSAENAAEMVEYASMLATSGFTTTDSALSVLTTAINAYGLEAEEASSISDSLIQVQNLGVTTIDQLASSMGKAISTASAYNIDLGNLESSYVSLTKAGISTEESTTYLASMFNELGDTGSDVAAIIEDETGSSFAELMDQGYSLGDVMGIVYEACDEDATALMNLWSSAEAGKASNAIVSQGLEEFNENLQAITNSSGATETAYETMADTAEYSFTKMQTNMTNLMTVIGDDLNPVLVTLADGVSNVVGWITSVIEEYPALSGVILGIGTALVTVTGVLAIAVAVVPKLTAAIGTLNTAMAANPALLVASAIAGVATAAVTAFAVISANTEEAIDETQDLIDAQNELGAAYASTKLNIDDTYGSARDYASQIEELSGIEEKNAGQKEQMVAAVEALNELVPDLNLSYDEETDSLSKSTEAIEAYINAGEKTEDYLADTEELTQALQNQEETQAALVTAQEKLTAAEDAYNEMSENTVIMTDAQAQELLNLRGKMEEAQEEVDTLTEQYDSQTEHIELLQEAIDEYETGNIADENEAAYESLNSLITNISDLETAYNEAAEEAYESMHTQMDLFDEAAEVSTTDFDTIMDNMQSQVEYWQNYSDNLDALYDKNIEGLDEVVNYILEHSDDPVSAIASMAEMSNAELESVIAEYGYLADAQQDSSESAANWSTDYTNSMSKAVKEATSTIKGLDVSDEAKEAAIKTLKAYQNGIISTDDLLDAISEISDEIADAVAEGLGLESEAKQSGINTVLGFVTGLGSKNAEISKAAMTIGQNALDSLNNYLDINSPSKIFKKSGQSVVEGFVKGIETEESSVTSVMQEMGENITDSFDASLDTVEVSASALGSLSGSGSSAVSVTQNIYSQKQTAADLMKEARWEQQRLVLRSV